MTITFRSDPFRSEVETLEIKLERRFEYDATFMRDRFVYLARSGNQQGYSAMGLPDDALLDHRDDVMSIVRDHLPAMRRRVIDGALLLGYEKDLLARERQIRELRAEIQHLRRPLRQKVREGLARWWEGRRR